MADAVGGQNEQRNVWKDTMKFPVIHGWQDSLMECNMCVSSGAENQVEFE